MKDLKLTESEFDAIEKIVNNAFERLNKKSGLYTWKLSVKPKQSKGIKINEKKLIKSIQDGTFNKNLKKIVSLEKQEK